MVYEPWHWYYSFRNDAASLDFSKHSALSIRQECLTFQFHLKAKDISQIAAERPTEQTSIWEMKGKKQRHIWKRGCSLALWGNYWIITSTITNWSWWFWVTGGFSVSLCNQKDVCKTQWTIVMKLMPLWDSHNPSLIENNVFDYWCFTQYFYMVFLQNHMMGWDIWLFNLAWSLLFMRREPFRS